MRSALGKIGTALGSWFTAGQSRWWETPLIPGLVATVFGLGLLGTGLWEPLEQIVYTGLFLTRDRLTDTRWDDRIFVITIDDASLATYGAFPWPRSRYGALLEKLMAVQPAAVGLDILMSESTPDDPVLAEMIRYSGNIVLATAGDGEGNAIWVSPSLTELAGETFWVGHVKHTPDADGVSRRAFLYERHDSEGFPSFSVALMETYLKNLGNLVRATAVELPAYNAAFFAEPSRFDQTQPVLINWPGSTRPSSPGASKSPQGLTTLSFVDVMADAEGETLAQLQNKIVMVGYSATGVVGHTEDALRTPFERNVPTAGVYLHAAILDNLLNDRFLERLPREFTLMMIVLSGLGSSLLLKPLGLRGRLVFVLGVIPVWFAVAYGSFLANLWIPVAAPIGTGLMGVMAFQFVEQQKRQSLMDLFTINLSPEMANLILRHQGELLNKGCIRAQELTATLLFCDIRGFTTITERLPSHVLLPWLNRYFEVMTNCVMAHQGVVDKYIGDAIMAAFGAPIPRTGEKAIQKDAIAAVEAALLMVQQLQVLNREFSAQGLPTVRFGIGLHTGLLVAGTVGSRHRASYSLFGDTVNVAARLQDMTKQLDQDSYYPLLMSEATYAQVGDRFPAVEQDRVLLRGRTTGTTAYALKKAQSEAFSLSLIEEDLS